MKQLPMSDKHREKLLEYGLGDMYPESCCTVSYKAGEILLREGMPLTWLGIIVCGKAKICSTAPNGRNLVLCYYISEGIIGDLELMTGLKTATTTIAAITDFETRLEMNWPLNCCEAQPVLCPPPCTPGRSGFVLISCRHPTTTCSVISCPMSPVPWE